VHRPPTSDREVIVSATRRATGFRRAIAGACLIAAPLLFAAAELLFPESSGDAGQQLATFAAHRTAETTAALLSVAMVVVFIPGLAGLVHLLRGRGWVWGLIGAAMMFFGLVTAHATLSGANLVFADMARPGLDKTAMTALLDKILHDPVAFPLLLGHQIFALGLVLLGVGLWRGRIGPRWAAVCVALFPISDVVLSTAVPNELIGATISNALGIVGFAALGLSLLSLSDTAWRGVDTGTAEPTPGDARVASAV
jgi:hypothetical protein